MKQRMTRAKRAKLTYSAISKMVYMAGFSEGIAQERRMVDRLNRCAFEGLNRAMGEASELENERDEARRERDIAIRNGLEAFDSLEKACHELAELKARYKTMSACHECQFYNHECVSPEWCSSWITEEK